MSVLNVLFTPDKTSKDNKKELHYRTCNLCEAMCGLVIETKTTHQNTEIISIKGDKDDLFSEGHICPKATALQDLHEDPERLTKPLKKSKLGWETISWEQAFDEVATKIKSIQKEHGKDAFGTYLGNPTVHNTGALLYVKPLLQAIKSRNQFSATSVDQLPHHLVGTQLFGHQFTVPVPDLNRAQHMLIIGGNPVASNGSIMTAANTKDKIKAISKRGGKVVVIDPRRTETADIASQHHFIKPGTDALLLLAMLNTLFSKELIDLQHLSSLTQGVEALQQAASAYPASRVAALTGIAAKDIETLVIEFCQADSAICYGRMGTSVQAFGGLCQYLILAFNILTGNLDKPGSMMFSSPAIDMLNLAGRGHIDRYRSRVRKLPEANGEFPVATLADEITTPGQGQIKGMLISSGNPVLTTPNGEQLDEALKQLELLVSVDIYITETNRHADYILPPVSQLEREHYDIIFHQFAIHNTAKYSAPMFDKPKDGKHDWEIFHAITERLNNTKKLSTRIQTKAAGLVGPTAQLDLLLRTGRYGGKLKLQNGLSIQKLKQNPHGIDLGPLKSRLPGVLKTPDQQINLNNEFYLNDLIRLEKHFFSDSHKDAKNDLKNAEFLLIGRRHVRSNNSWMHNSHRLVKGKTRCTALMHPNDAQRLSIQTNETITVSSRVGSVEIPVEVCDSIMEGVISIPHGWGHNKSGARRSTAEKHAGVSCNTLTDDHQLDELCGTAVLNGVPVTVATL